MNLVSFDRAGCPSVTYWHPRVVARGVDEAIRCPNEVEFSDPESIVPRKEGLKG